MTSLEDAVVVVGGGIIGLSAAYYISQTQAHRKVYIVDSEDALLRSASGFSGGLIVRDWFSPAVLPLAELSFQLHKQLADANHGQQRWGYSASTALSLVGEELDAEGKRTGKVVRGEDWLLHGASRAEVARRFASAPLRQANPSDKQRDILLRADHSPVWLASQKGGNFERISSDSGCAQVEPKELSMFLLQACQANNTTILLSTSVKSIIRNEEGKMEGLDLITRLQHNRSVQRRVIKCRDVIISAGCWTPRVFETLFNRKMKIGVKPLAGYSLVVRSPRYSRHIRDVDETGELIDTAHSVFCPPGPNWTYSPEAMARMTGSGKAEIYVAGLNCDVMELPELAGQTRGLMDLDKLTSLRNTAVVLAGRETDSPINEDDLETVREGLCFRPVSESGVPIISRVYGIDSVEQGGGIYVATGHGPWGITLSLGTGLVLAEMIGGKKGSSLSADIAQLGLPQDLSLLQSRL